MPKRHLNDVVTRLRAVGLHPAVVQDLNQQIEKWEKCNGPEWTVTRLKSLKTDLVRHLAGKEPVGVYAKKVIKINGKLVRVPKGVYGHLFRIALLNLSDKRGRRKLHQVWQAMIAHTRYRITRPGGVTFTQWKKFSSAVRKPKPTKTELRGARRYVALGLRTLPKAPTYRGTPRALITLPPREGKSVPNLRTTRSEKQFLLAQAKELFAYNVFDDQVIKDLIEPVISGTPYSGKVKRYPKGGATRHGLHHIGIIGLIQEPGFKLRAVANPNRILQLALEPLGKQLYSWLKKVPEDCAYRQDSGMYTVQGILGRRLEVHSIDLSNATDVFPYELEEMVVAFARSHLPARRLLTQAAHGSWFLPLKSDVRKAMSLTWNRGLPLGLYPCFALFSLAHHALVRGICVSLGITDFPYRILGDDIVIWDDSVAEEYKRVMMVIGCPIAMDKSVSSRDVAEFAGRVITRKAILHGLKYGESVNDNAFLESVKSLGPRVIEYLLPKQRKVAKWLSEAAPPVGFGFNPRGLPYSERLAMSLAWELASPPKSAVAVDVQIRVVLRNWYSYKYSEVSWRHKDLGRWVNTRHSELIDQISSRGEYLGVPIQAFGGNVPEILDFQSLDQPLKGPAGELVRRVRALTSTAWPDHPFNKPLVQSLYRRLTRARELLPRVREWLSDLPSTSQ